MKISTSESLSTNYCITKTYFMLLILLLLFDSNAFKVAVKESLEECKIIFVVRELL